jgi:hypothetical protein
LSQGKAQADLLSPPLPVFDIFLQLLRILVCHIFVGVTDPELDQIPWHVALPQIGCAEAPEGMEALDVMMLMQPISEQVALQQGFARFRLK